jgi:hypothetical protein
MCSRCWGNDGTSNCQGGSDGSIYGTVSLASPADIQMLSGIVLIRGDLTVAADGALTDLVCLESLMRIEGNLAVSNMRLVYLHGLENLSTVTGRVQIEINSALTSLNGLSAHASAGEFRVLYNVALTEAAVPALTSVAAWNMVGNQNLPRCWPLLLEQRLGIGCAKCANDNYGNGACPAPVDGWINQEPNGAGYIITFASGGGAGSFATLADAHAAYPSLVLAEPVYDGFIFEAGPDWYFVRFYMGGGACCWSSVQEALNVNPQMLLYAP